MSDGNGVAIDVEPANYEPQPSALEQEIQALLESTKQTLTALRSARVDSDSQPYEVAERYLCEARRFARKAMGAASETQFAHFERLALNKLAAAKNVLGGGK